MEMIIMNLKNSMLLIALGVGGTLLYQQIKNGNVRNVVFLKRDRFFVLQNLKLCYNVNK